MGEIFGASVQYDDWKGDAAADDDDNRAIREFLEERGQLAEGEFLIGVEIWVGENHGGEVQQPQIHALIIEAADAEAAKPLLITIKPFLMSRMSVLMTFQWISSSDFLSVLAWLYLGKIST